MQAHKNAKDSTDEYIMDTFATQDKVRVQLLLIYLDERFNIQFNCVRIMERTFISFIKGMFIKSYFV
jgi:hypothetical protein